MTRFPLPVACIAVLSASASAQNLIDATEQIRSVQADAYVATSPQGGIMDMQEFVAGDFLPFAETAMASVAVGNAFGTAQATQDSSVGATALSGAGSVTASADANFETLSDGSGESTYFVRFNVEQPVDFSVTGVLDAQADGEIQFESRSALSLSDGTVPFFVNLGAQGTPAGVNVPVQEDGYLPPGEYWLTARATGVGLGDFGPADVSASFDFDFTLTPRAQSFCVGAVNSAGGAAALSTQSSVSIGANQFSIQVDDAVPNTFGLMYYGPNQIQIPFGDGFRCVGGAQYRLQPPVALDGTGAATKTIDFTVGPQSSGPGAIQPESVWNFQFWYRDPMGAGGSGFNLSDGLEVRFAE